MHSFERGRPPENRLETGASVYRFLKRLGFFDVRQDHESFESWVNGMTYDEFESHLVRLNGMLRKIPSAERGIDGDTVHLAFGPNGDQISYLPPRAEVKDMLMKEAFEGMQAISHDKDRALLAYYAIQAIHPFSDGNGRTGRLLYELLAPTGGDLTQEQVEQLVDHDSGGHEGVGEGRKVFAEKVLDPERAYTLIDRELAKKVLGSDFVDQYGKIYYSGMLGSAYLPEIEGLSPDEHKLAERIISEGAASPFSIRSLVVLRLVNELGISDQVQIPMTATHKGSIFEDKDKKIFGIDSENFIESLDADRVRRLIAIHDELKVQFIETMIDVFAHPEQHQLKTKGGDTIPLKEVFSLSE